jgi:Co/Zn/Cd efflux system component
VPAAVVHIIGDLMGNLGVIVSALILKHGRSVTLSLSVFVSGFSRL